MFLYLCLALMLRSVSLLISTHDDDDDDDDDGSKQGFCFASTQVNCD